MPLSWSFVGFRLLPALLFSYLVGGIPMGVLLTKRKGIDIRSLGSGNTGATNVYRNAGVTLGILVLAGDALKAVLAVLAGRLLMPGFAPAEVLCGLLAIVGHNWSVYLGFKGGKGMATSLGVVATTVPVSVLALLPIWLVVVSLSGYVSLGSVTVAALLPLIVRLIYPTRPWHFVFAIVAAVMAIWRHRANIHRLLTGTEHRLFKGGER